MFPGSKFDEAALRLARDHLSSQGDTDIFPKPFEIDAIVSEWDTIEAELLKKSIGSYKWVGGRRLIIPKGKYSFRVATQLDPIDSLILTAIIVQYGDEIEQIRINKDKEIAYSYRFFPSKDGGLYDVSADRYKLFWAKSIERAEDCKFVAITDVTDYYNQVYHHTIENQLKKAKLPNDVIESIKRLLNNLTQTSSRGIPIGPHSIHLLAELAFDPIDRSIRLQGYNHCRFVDDIHVFCSSKNEAELALFDLANILDKQQRLVLQRFKTKIIPSEEFIMMAQKALNDLPINDEEKTILKIINAHSQSGPYGAISIKELSADELKVLDEYNYESLFESYLSYDDPNYPRIRWLYRRLAQIGIPHAVSFSINNLERIVPAIGDAAKYLVSAENNFDGKWDDIGENLIKSLENIKIIKHSEYLQMILVNLFSNISDLDHVEILLKNYNTSSDIVKRKIVKAATTSGADFWLRERKEDITSVDPWLKRSLMLGASTFQDDERRFWLKNFKSSDNLLEKVIANWLIEGGSINPEILTP